jgi:hypothetical protein
MNMTPVEELVQRLEPLTHAARVRAMIDLGRSEAEESKALIAALEQGGFFERFMALYTCFGSHDSAQVKRALADPSRIIRGLAIRLLPLVCDEATLADTLEHVPPQLRLPILWKLRQHGQERVLDAFLEAALEQQAESWTYLLPFGSDALVRRCAAQFRAQAPLIHWERLARFHPAAVLDLLLAWASEGDTFNQQLLDYANKLLPALVRADSAGALRLFQTLRRTTPLEKIDQHPLRLLVEAYPQEFAEIVYAERSKLSLSAGAIVAWLSAEQIVTLYDEREQLIGWSFSWSRYLTPAQRLAVYQAGWKQFLDDDELAEAIAALLPGPQREQEARKQIARLKKEPDEQRAYFKFLPWDEALGRLEPLLHASDTDTRQEAFQTLFEMVTYRKDHLPDALTLLRAYRAEHDSVRRAFLEGLHRLSASIWREEYLPDLTEIIRHGLNDVGLSPETLHVITNLVLKLLPVHLDWATAQLATVLRERGLALPRGRGANRFPAGLADEQVQSVLSVLWPILHIWLEREKEEELLNVVKWFAAYPLALERLALLLATVLQHTRSTQTVSAVFGLLARNSPQSLRALIPALLEEDRSWITFAQISGYLHRQRQDLLALFLAFQPYVGRWSTGRKRFLMPIPSQFTAPQAQQERYADALLEVIGDEAQESQEQTQAVKRLASLPAISAARLIALANDARPVVRTPALFALGRLDTDAGLPTLIESLADGRARIAVLALRSFLRQMPPAQALEVVGRIPLDRVTVAKESVRLTAEIGSEEAFQTLLALEQRDLHRDVRLALLRSLLRFPEHPASWAILERAAQDAHTNLVDDVLPGRNALLELQQQMRGQEATFASHLLRLLLMQLDHPDQETRKSALRFCARFMFKDREALLVPRLLTFLAAPTTDTYELSLAVEAIFNVFVESEVPLIIQTVKETPANRRVLDEIEDALMDYQSYHNPLFGVFARALLPVLAEDPMTVSLRVKVVCRYFPVDELAAFFQALAGSNELHAEALMDACNLFEGLGYQEKEPEQLERLETTLAASQDERLRRLALALLRGRGRSKHGWDQARLERLYTYRSDRSVLVAAAAQFTLPTEEGKDEDEEDEDDE